MRSLFSGNEEYSRVLAGDVSEMCVSRQTIFEVQELNYQRMSNYLTIMVYVFT